MHLLTNTDRNLPALVVTFDESSAELPQAGAKTAQRFAAGPGRQAKPDRAASPLHSPPAAEEQPVSRPLAALLRTQPATMQFLAAQGVEPERMRLSQSAAYEPLTTRLETSWQNENNCVEVFLLTEVVDKVAGTTQAAQPSQP